MSVVAATAGQQSTSVSPDQTEQWRGCLAIAASLMGLGCCAILALAFTFADRLPRQLDRYLPLEVGQASLYRVTYADGSTGFLSANIVKPSPESLSYAAVFGDGGIAVQQQLTFTNWEGGGQTLTRHYQFSRSGNRLSHIATQEAGMTTVANPPLPIWTPDLLDTHQDDPLSTQTVIGDTAYVYSTWFAGTQGVQLPDGVTVPAARIDSALKRDGEVVWQARTWYAAGVGIVRRTESDESGQPLQQLELINSSTLAASPAALPLSELLSGQQPLAFFRENAARSGAHTDAALPDPKFKVAFRASVGNGFTASPAYADGLLYVADQGGHLLALDAHQATVRWAFTAGGPIVAAPAVAGGIVYVGAGDKSLYALEAQQGLFLWRVRFGDNIATSPVVSEGTLLVGGEDRTLYALDSLRGSARWQFAAGDRIVSSPAVAGGRVYFGADDSQVYALDPATGALLWRRKLDAPVAATVAVAESGVVFAASTGEQLVALDATTGTVLWTDAARFGYLASPAIGEHMVFAADTGGAVRALWRESGELAWELPGDYGRSYTSSPLLLGDALLAADNSGVLRVVSAADGQLLYSLALASDVTASPTWGADTVFIATQGGQVLALQAGPDVLSVSFTPLWDRVYGDEIRNFEATIPAADPLYEDGRLYVVLHTGDLWRIDATSGAGERLAQFAATVEAAPTLSAGVLYVGTRQGAVIAYDLVQRATVWKTQLEGEVRLRPAVAAGLVFVHSQLADRSGTLSALDAGSGRVVWERLIPNGNSAPVAAAGSVYVGGEAILALDAATGEEHWRSVPFETAGALAVHDGVVYAAGVGRGDVTFVALGAADGETLWVSEEPARFSATQSAYDAHNRIVVAGAQDGQVYAFDVEAGSLRWRFQADSAVLSDVRVQDSVVFFTSFNGTLYAVNAQTGALLADYRRGTAVSTYVAPIAMPDRIYGVNGNTLYALEISR